MTRMYARRWRYKFVSHNNSKQTRRHVCRAKRRKKMATFEITKPPNFERHTCHAISTIQSESIHSSLSSPKHSPRTHAPEPPRRSRSRPQAASEQDPPCSFCLIRLALFVAQIPRDVVISRARLAEGKTTSMWRLHRARGGVTLLLCVLSILAAQQQKVVGERYCSLLLHWGSAHRIWAPPFQRYDT